ncbi:MAG: pilus assembly protein TadG-related protein [Candidatus Limnocylindrales bacterium]
MTTSRERGQVLVLFVLSLTALMGAAGLAIDIGRFYTERRFLENAADAAALAAANSLIRGNDAATARDDARAVLTRNFTTPPNGIVPALPPASGSEVYASGQAGVSSALIDGILIEDDGDIRVAIRNTVPYTFGRLVGLNTNMILGRARVALQGDMLPIAVRHFVNAPGPTTGASSPCTGNGNAFQDLVATADTACLGTESNRSLRQVPSPGMAFSASSPNNDPSHHGPIIALVGQGAQSSNSSSFRGFVALDIRDFESASSNVFYNGVDAGTNANTLKSKEAGWVATGYPGPMFPPVTTPPDPNDQVALMDGNSSGIIISAVNNRYQAGDEILAAVYSGTVMTIPDFALTVPGTVTINGTQTRNGAVTMTVTKNSAFTGVVTSSAFADWGDATNPLTTGTLAPLTFSPSPATPNTTITWTTFSTTAAPVGISSIWIKGHSSSPYLTDHYYPVAVNVGGVARDFSSTGNGQVIATTTTGGTAAGTMSFSTPNSTTTAFAGPVTLTIEGGPGELGVLPSGIGSLSVSPSTFTLSKGASQAVTVTLNGGSLAAGEYPLTIRASGTNSDGQVVTRLVPIVFDIATAGTSSNYVDIMGFAVFRITSVNSNSVDGYAISGVYADMNDSGLRRGQVARLVPWN